MGWTPAFANQAASGDLTVGIIGLGLACLLQLDSMMQGLPFGVLTFPNVP